MGGRPPKTAEAHRKNGTYKPCRHANRGTKLVKVDKGIDCPASLKGEAAEVWKTIIPELAKAGLLTLVDAPQLEHAFKCYQEAQECLQQVHDVGGIVEYYKNKKVHDKDLYQIYLMSMQEWERIMYKYGMTPVEACKIRNNVNKDKDNDDDLLKEIMGNG